MQGEGATHLTNARHPPSAAGTLSAVKGRVMAWSGHPKLPHSEQPFSRADVLDETTIDSGLHLYWCVLSTTLKPPK